jgi:hypothetical protein
MSASIDNLINVNFTKGRNDLLKFGLMLGGKGQHRPYDPLGTLIRALFGAGEQGAFYIPRPVVNGTQALFQDAAGTVPVTADGDPVGSMADQSPNDRSSIQSVSTRRPVYSTDGALNFASFDGIDSFLLATYGAAVTPPCTLSIAMNRLDTTNAAILLGGLDSSIRHQISLSGSRILIGVSGGSSISGNELPVGKHIITLVINGASSSLRVDGLVVASGTLDNSAAATGLSISASGSGSYSFRQDVYGIVHAEGIDKVDDIESYLSGLAGVAI